MWVLIIMVSNEVLKFLDIPRISIFLAGISTEFIKGRNKSISIRYPSLNATQEILFGNWPMNCLVNMHMPLNFIELSTTCVLNVLVEETYILINSPCSPFIWSCACIFVTGTVERNVSSRINALWHITTTAIEDNYQANIHRNIHHNHRYVIAYIQHDIWRLPYSLVCKNMNLFVDFHFLNRFKFANEIYCFYNFYLLFRFTINLRCKEKIWFLIVNVINLYRVKHIYPYQLY